MNPQTLQLLTQVAVIYLMLTAMVVAILTAVGLGIAWWYLRKGRKSLAVPFLYAQVYALRAQHVTMKASDKIASVPIGINAAAEQVNVTAKTLLKKPNEHDDSRALDQSN